MSADMVFRPFRWLGACGVIREDCVCADKVTDRGPRNYLSTVTSRS